MYTLDWVYCEGGIWCSFDDMNMRSVTASGVYVVWRRAREAPHLSPVTVYVGKGQDIRARLQDHRRTGIFDRQRRRGWDMFVTWANVPIELRKGVERFLANVLRPRVGLQHPNVTPVSVNLPPDLV